MNIFRLLCMFGFMIVNLSGCITFPTDESLHVKILWDNPLAVNSCTHKGTIIGSQGHFYDYWLHSDKDMVWGTLNEMRIKAHQLNADTVYLYEHFGFLSSVTLIGNAYDCSQPLILETTSGASAKN
ncbi:DUF4156 domain-containing protein [Shewanella baltica]|uniref:DUF4156 domain-containing protein n=1 Tax=Shewanella baltica TaxID=62322 RepID=UPI00217EEC47|nr:DUF4156 domain-containing protein [Shewanella baltica]